jgi:hypothetical protein
MVKPSNARELLTRLVTRRGGDLARLRRGVTATEVAEAVAFVRQWFSKADLGDPKTARDTCTIAMDAALGPDRVPDPNDDWDLVAVYARCRAMKRQEACYELGLRKKPHSQTVLPGKQYVYFMELITTHGAGTRRRLKKHLDPAAVRQAMQLVQKVRPHLDFIGNAVASGAACHTCFKKALSQHDPPWEPDKHAWKPDEHETLGWDLVAVYMRLTGIETRKEACEKMGLHAPLPKPA